MDADYWKARCEAAESALRRARSALQLHPVRKAVITTLGELHAGQAMATGQVARRLRWPHHRAMYVLVGMERVGLVDRASTERCGGRGKQVQWKLGHLVQDGGSE